MGNFRGWEWIIMLMVIAVPIIVVVLLVKAVRQPASAPYASGPAPAGWFPDPEQPGQYRYWDGQQWTDNRTTSGPPE